MNCRTCQFELSQCLDGRLPSGRRTVVMQHVAECDGCATFWNELQQAQQLTLQLPRQHVSADFRQQLWARIEAGEGTPEAVFHQPVPLATKVRYLLSGASMAAAVLFGLMLLRTPAPTQPTTEIAQHDPRPAPVIAQPADLASGGHRLTPRPQPDFVPADAGLAMFGGARPLTPDLICVEAARQFERTFDFTNRQLTVMGQQRGPHGAFAGLREKTVELHDLGSLLLDLRRDNRFAFDDATIDADLRLLVRTLDQQPADEDEFARFVVPTIRDAQSLANMSASLKVSPARASNDESAFLLRLSQVWPEAFPRLFILAGSDLCDLEELNPARTFAFHDHCGVQQFVVPRSEVEDSVVRMRVLRVTTGGGELHIQVKTK